MNKKKIISIILIVSVSLALGLFYFYLRENNVISNKETKKEQQLENFKIFLPSTKELITKEVYAKKEIQELKKIETIIESFLRELPPPFKETRILGIYRDKENIVYIDLSSDFCAPMDSLQEYLMLKAFYKTLKNNFPWINDIKILINNKEIETLSGHFLIENSLKEYGEEN
jgi:predicted secreted protein